MSFHKADYNPVNTKRYFDVHSTLFERYERQMDVETTLCAYWEDGQKFLHQRYRFQREIPMCKAFDDNTNLYKDVSGQHLLSNTTKNLYNAVTSRLEILRKVKVELRKKDFTAHQRIHIVGECVLTFRQYTKLNLFGNIKTYINKIECRIERNFPQKKSVIPVEDINGKSQRVRVW